MRNVGPLETKQTHVICLGNINNTWGKEKRERLAR